VQYSTSFFKVGSRSGTLIAMGKPIRVGFGCPPRGVGRAGLSSPRVTSRSSMEVSTMEFFLHGAGRPKVIRADLAESLGEVLRREDALPQEGHFVFVGEPEDAIHDPDAEADVHAPADTSLSLHALELTRHKHIHTRAPHRIEVTVRYNGEHRRKFSPAATVATVTRWAKKRFHIDPVAGAEWVLALLPGKEQPRPSEHLGELLKPGSHSLEFELVREENPQG
jgi:hypothetical protein